MELAARAVFGFVTLADFRAVEPVFAAAEVLALVFALDVAGLEAAARFFVAVALRAGLFAEAFARRAGFLAAGTE